MLLAFLLVYFPTVIIYLLVPPINSASSLVLTEATLNGKGRNTKPTESASNNVVDAVGEANLNTNVKESAKDTDKSVGTHIKEIDALIEAVPEEHRFFVQKIHQQWIERAVVLVERAQAREVALVNKLTQVTEYAIERYCAMNLRSAIEGVRVRCVSAHTEDEQKQSRLKGGLGTFWMNRKNTLCSVLFALSSVMKSVQENTEDEQAKQNFKTQVDRLRDLELILPDDKSDFLLNELIKEIKFLNEIEKPDESRIWELWKAEHKNFWLKKSAVWKSETDLNSPNDASIIQNLVKNIKQIDPELFPTKLETHRELDYLMAIVRVHVNGMQLSKQGEQCLWMTAIHPESFFSRVVIEVTKTSNDWKGLDEMEKRLRFCDEYGRFYNTLSTFNPHRDAPALPNFCKVGSEDYKKYVKRVSQTSPDLRAVGRALLQLTVEDELFEKPNE